MAEVKVGTCLEESFDKSLWKIVSEEYRNDKRWLKIRKEHTFQPRVIPVGYIPYSYRPIEECPPSLSVIPPPPAFAKGDCVAYTYYSRGKVKTQIGRIDEVINDEASIQVPSKVLGVYGITFQDVYTLNRLPHEECEKAFKERVAAAPETVVDYDRRYNLEQLREMCRDKGLSVSGDKKTLVRRLFYE